ncbi:hypothetical protein AX761_19475 [Rhizobium sp. 58]|nr:hypothetical protein AX761_19475 [Rhizobium sp. 58]
MSIDLLWNLLNLGGFGLSIFAALTAKSARQAATEAAASVVSKKNQQEDTDRLKALLLAVRAAKDTAMRRQVGAPEVLSAGHDISHDIQALRTAHDALVSGLPLDFEDGLQSDAQSAADEISKGLNNIEDVGANRDGWKDCLSTLQVLLPRLEQEERRQRDQELMAQVRS